MCFPSIAKSCALRSGCPGFQLRSTDSSPEQKRLPGSLPWGLKSQSNLHILVKSLRDGLTGLLHSSRRSSDKGQRTEIEEHWTNTTQWVVSEAGLPPKWRTKRGESWWLRQKLPHTDKGEVSSPVSETGQGKWGWREVWWVGNEKQFMQRFITATDVRSGRAALYQRTICLALYHQNLALENGFHWMISLLLLFLPFLSSVSERGGFWGNKKINEMNGQKLASTIRRLGITVPPKWWFVN